MRAPLSWLREYVSVDATAHEIARRLNVSALEVERVIDVGVADVGDNLSYLRVGKVVAADKHPNADKLQLCQVDVGEGEPRQIVCGAWNFGVGATVAVGLPGVLLPGFPAPLDERPLRGELSRGMILAEDEIGLGSDHAGIMVLPDGIEPGTPLADVLPVHEQVLDCTTTMNRVDLLSMVGLAREVATLFDGELLPVVVDDPAIVHPEWVDVTIDDPEAARATSGACSGTSPSAPSPMWLRARLARGRHAVDLERRRRHELRHARLREPTARVRPREARRRPHPRAPGHGRRGADHARRHAAEAGRARPADHRRDEGGRARGDHGRPGQRDLGRDDRGAARGRQLRADRDPPHVRAPRPAHRGLESLGEGRRSRTRPSPPPCWRAVSSSISPAPSSPAVPTCTPACLRAPSSGCGRSGRIGSSASRSRPPSSAGSSSGSGST